MKKKLAIIGAALFQEPAIIKAKEMGIETHVFAWRAGTPGEEIADYFYPISIREKEEILKKCIEVGIDGIVSIASDLAMETVNYVASEMGLYGNSLEATLISTNKHLMRKAFELNGDPTPKSILVDGSTDVYQIKMEYPLIVKPTDRSGSRGVHKVHNFRQLMNALAMAREYSFEDKAVVEEFVEGDEYSVEYISFRGRHEFLSVTQKLTTGAPHFIETGHRQPAPISTEIERKIKDVSEHALNTLGLDNGAAHIEVKVNGDDIKIIEIGGRMGGDFIGSHLIPLSTGYDFVKACIDVALGEEPEKPIIEKNRKVGVNFIFNQEDVIKFNEFLSNNKDKIVEYSVDDDLSDAVTDSSNRHGYYIFKI